MMIEAEDWIRLESTPPPGAGIGVALRRIAPSSGHDLFVGVRFPERLRQLIVEVPSNAWPTDLTLPVFKSLSGSTSCDGPILKATIELQDRALADVFTALANDVAGHVAGSKGHAAGVTALVERLGRWRRLMEPDAGGGMTLEERRGLFGELRVLELAVEAGVEPNTALSAWVGPLEAHQDFQRPAVAVEVKATSTKQPQAVTISSERQLDSTGIPRLILVHVSLDERKQGAGVSLPEMILQVRTLLGPTLETAFDGLVTSYGWLPGHESRYQSPVYMERSVEAFDVVDGFPRIVEVDCPPGLGDVRYVIQLGALTPFEVDVDEVLILLGEAQ